MNNLNALNESINTSVQNIKEQPADDDGDIKYQNIINKAFEQAGLPQNKLNSLLDTLKNQIFCDEECQKEQTTQEYKQKIEKMQNDFNNYENNVEAAEKQMYALGGPIGVQNYNKVLNERNAKKTSEFIKNQTSFHNEIVNELKLLVKTHNNNNDHINTINEYLDVKLKEKERLESEIDKYKANVQTVDRKVVYEIDDIESNKFYRKLLTILFYILIVLYFIYSDLFSSDKYKKLNTWIVFILYLIFPLFINKIIYYLYIAGNRIKTNYT